MIEFNATFLVAMLSFVVFIMIMEMTIWLITIFITALLIIKVLLQIY